MVGDPCGRSVYRTFKSLRGLSAVRVWLETSEFVVVRLFKRTGIVLRFLKERHACA